MSEFSDKFQKKVMADDSPKKKCHMCGEMVPPSLWSTHLMACPALVDEDK